MLPSQEHKPCRCISNTVCTFFTSAYDIVFRAVMQKIKATLISNKGSSAIHGGRFKLPPLCERRGNERTTNTLINNEGKYTFLSTEGACRVLIL